MLPVGGNYDDDDDDNDDNNMGGWLDDPYVLSYLFP
jgi:hypothetical protein